MSATTTSATTALVAGEKPSARLRSLIHAGDASLAPIASFLDALDHERRLEATRGLGMRDQRRLWDLAAGGQPCSLDDLVAGAAQRAPVRNHGKNTLGLPIISRFEKRFCRPLDGSARLFGYNEGATRPFIGPGYFVAVPTAGNAEWEERGAVVIDYYQLPDGPVADGWPAMAPNSRGLSFFVYHRMRDFMRRVSSHVTVGAAYRVEKPMGQYFVLCREP